MVDRYEGYQDSTTPATRSTPIAPGDLPLDPLPKAILVGGAGVIVGRLRDDTADRTFKVQAGYHPLRFKLIRAAGTTATDLVGLD